MLLTALAAAGSVLGATSSRGEPTHRNLSPFYTPSPSLTTAPPTEPTTLPPQAGYRGVENFCAVAPLTGTLHYDGAGGATGDLSNVLTIAMAGLPPNSYIYVAWSNDHVRVPIIAGFSTNSTARGDPVLGRRRARLAEVRGVEIFLSGGSPDLIPPPLLGRLEPC